MVDQADLLAVLIVGLVALGLLAFIERQFLVAGVTFLAVSLAIFLRETRT